jgi:hypothetical protein
VIGTSLQFVHAAETRDEAAQLLSGETQASEARATLRAAYRKGGIRCIHHCANRRWYCMNDFKIAEACLRADDVEINIPQAVNPVTPSYRAHLTGSQKLLGNAYLTTSEGG